MFLHFVDFERARGPVALHDEPYCPPFVSPVQLLDKCAVINLCLPDRKVVLNGRWQLDISLHFDGNCSHRLTKLLSAFAVGGAAHDGSQCGYVGGHRSVVIGGFFGVHVFLLGWFL